MLNGSTNEESLSAASYIHEPEQDPDHDDFSLVRSNCWRVTIVLRVQQEHERTVYLWRADQ